MNALLPEESGPAGRPSSALASGLPATALGLRLLALAAVAGSSALLPVTAGARALLAAGVLVGALLGFAHYLVAVRRLRVPGELFVVTQLGVWSVLLAVSGGQRSPLFLGLLLEVPLTAVLLSRRGCLLAAGGGAIAYLIVALAVDPPLDPARAALAIGFLVVTAILTTLLIEVLERQRRQIDSTQAALRARAENLAEELRLLGDYLGGALLGLDDLGRVVSVNRAGEELLGVKREAAVGRAWPEVLRLDAEGRGSILRTLAEGVAQRGLRLVLEGPDDRRTGVEAEVWVSPSAQGRMTWVLLGTASPERTEGDPLRRLGEAVACVSHQIKNSLHALQGFAGEIEQELGSANGRESTRDLRRALQSLGSLAEDVLAMSGAPRPTGEVVSVREALSTAVTLTRVPGVPVHVVPGPDPQVRAPRGPLVHALFNLLDNACRVSPRGHAVEVRVIEAEDRAVVEIRDGGPGLPESLAHLDGRAPSANGSGYGLLAARRFLEANEGELSFERLVEGGTASRIALRRVLGGGEPIASAVR